LLSSNDKKRYAILILVALISVALRLWLLDQRWVNPDEGAHLMDAVLANEGKIPLVDFESRQPVYTYMIATVFRFTGSGLQSGRVMNLLLSMAVGVLIFFIAKQLFNKEIAFLSTLIYWAIPLEIVNSVVVKMQPLTLFFSCFSFLSLIKYLKTRHAWWLILAGTLAALGYYVRQSALIVPLVTILVLLTADIARRDRFKGIGFFLIGYLGCVTLVMGFYSRYMDLKDVVSCGLNPFEFMLQALKKMVLTTNMTSTPIAETELAGKLRDITSNNYNLYDRYIHQATYMHLFLFVGAAFSLIPFGRHFIRNQRKKIDDYTNSLMLLYFWVAALFLAYAYYYYTRGFFIDYFREFLPPLVILLSVWICDTVKALKTENAEIPFSILLISFASISFLILKTPRGLAILTEFILISIGLFAGVYFAMWQKYSDKSKFIFPFFIAVCVGVGCLLMATNHKVYRIIAMIFIFISPFALMVKGLKVTKKEYTHYIMLSIIVGTFLYGYAISGRSLGVMYDSVWSPNAVSDVAKFLKANTQKTDQVISGAVIWELEARRKPYMNKSHPLALALPISENERKLLKASIFETPPAIVIMDGYTEKTYLRQVPTLKRLLTEAYSKVYTAGPARMPVEIFQYRSSD